MSEQLTEAQRNTLDRWLASRGIMSHDLHVVVARMVAEAEGTARADAWDEGHRLTAPHSDRCEPTCPNPYRNTP